MDTLGFSIFLFVIFYLLYLLTTVGEFHISTSDNIFLRKILDDDKSGKDSTLRNLLRDRSSHLRTTTFFSLLVFIMTLFYFHKIIFGSSIVSSELSWDRIIIIIIYIYFAGHFVPALLTGIKNQAFINLLLRYSSFIHRLFNPLLYPSTLLNRIFLNKDNGFSDDNQSGRTEDARAYIEDGTEKGFFESEEEKMLHSIVEFGDTIVKEVMTPRVDMIYVHRDSTIEEMIKTVNEHNHSRYPVYGENIDDIVGIINIQELFKAWGKDSRNLPISKFIMEPYFVPESKMVDDLLREMQQRHIQMSIVVDEYGGTAGLVTIEDLLEEIVGEIQDEYESDEDDILENEDGSYTVLGKTDVDELEEVLNLPLKDDSYETISGMIFNELGRVPRKNEKIEIRGLIIEVIHIHGRKIEKVRIRKTK